MAFFALSSWNSVVMLWSSIILPHEVFYKLECLSMLELFLLSLIPLLYWSIVTYDPRINLDVSLAFHILDPLI